MKVPGFFRLILLLTPLTVSNGTVDISASHDGSVQVPASPDAVPEELRSAASPVPPAPTPSPG